MRKILLLAAVCLAFISSPTFGSIVYSGSQVTLALQGGMSPPPKMVMISFADDEYQGDWDDFTISLVYTELMDATGMSIGMGTRLTILGGMGANGMGEVVGMDTSGMGQAFNLARGALIDSTNLADNGQAVLLSEGFEGQTINGEFGASGGYIGLVMPGSSYYGWLHMSGMLNIGESFQSITFDGRAYQDQEGVPITAGAVPIPGAVCLVAIGALCLTHIRRRLKS